MSEIEFVPDDRRERIDDLIARKQQSRAIELLDVWVNQFAVTPWAFERLGELLLEAGERDKAGRAFFWSGVRGDADREACIDSWLRGLHRRPARIVDSLSQRARLPVADMPGALPKDLAALKVTDAVAAKANREKPAWVDWLIVISFIWFVIIGVITTYQWISAGVRSLLG